MQFQCPACKAFLEYEGGDSAFQTCRSCKGKIIVPSDVFRQPPQRSPERAPAAGQDAVISEIRRELARGRKIAAIKLFRDHFGSDLATSKAAIERLAKDFASEDAVAEAPYNTQTSQDVVRQKGKPVIFSAIVRVLIFGGLAYWIFKGC